MKHVSCTRISTSGLADAGHSGAFCDCTRFLAVSRASLAWPTADGLITRIDIERRQDTGIGGGHYFCATFSYDFRDAPGRSRVGKLVQEFLK